MEQSEAIRISDEAVAELQEANIIVMGAPMYSFTVPSTLNVYFDHIARPGLTFRYSEQGPEGLVKNKKAYIATSSGGIYSDGAMQAYQRYHRPVVLSETGHFGDGRAAWYDYVARECRLAAGLGVSLLGVCLYPLICRPDWDDLAIYR